MIDVVTICTPAYKSNSYIIRDSNTSKVIVVDPTIYSVSEIVKFLFENNSILEIIIPTHGHLDHIEGIDILRVKYRSQVITTRECSLAFQDPRKNYSRYIDNKNISIGLPDLITDKDPYIFRWCNSEISIIKTPGHSPCSTCIAIDNKMLFGGDTILLDYSPFTKLPDSDSNSLKESIKMIIRDFSPDTVTFPGHGKSFLLNSVINKFDFLHELNDRKTGNLLYESGK
jgi:hydroxyacylglutathione hydrolase